MLYIILVVLSVGFLVSAIIYNGTIATFKKVKNAVTGKLEDWE